MIFKVENINNFNLKSDLQIIEDIFDLSDNQLAMNTELEPNIINNLITGKDTVANKEELEAIYNYAFNNNLYLSDLKWQMYSDEYNTEYTKVLCHGSRNMISGSLRLDANGDSNDFANGFYCGENVKQAGMFVSSEPDSSLYILVADTSKLSSCQFYVDTNWMLAVAYYRDTLGKYSNHPKVQKIIESVETSDLVIAPIADNRMFEIIDQFINGELTDKQCQHALSATQLGYQHVFRTQKALEQIQLLERCYLCSSEKAYYNRSNERESNTSLNKSVLAKKLYSTEGKYISELLS